MEKVFDGEEYEGKRICKHSLDIEEHSLDGSAVLEGCSCIQERHFLGLESSGEQYSSIATKPENKEFGRKTATYAAERLKTVYEFHSKHPMTDKDYEEKAWEFYSVLADETRAIRKEFLANNPFPDMKAIDAAALQRIENDKKTQKKANHMVKCGCKGCPPCHT